jgi:hypothetical protein
LISYSIQILASVIEWSTYLSTGENTMKYKVIYNFSKLDEHKETMYKFEREVNQEIGNGWELQGGVSISRSDDEVRVYFIIAQALIKE